MADATPFMNMDDVESQQDGTATNATQTSNRPWYLNWKNWLKITFLLILIAVIVLAIIYSDTTKKIFTDFLTWMQDNAAAGSFAFIALYWFCTVMFIPGSLLTLGAGFVFRAVAGPVESYTYTSISIHTPYTPINTQIHSGEEYF